VETNQDISNDKEALREIAFDKEVYETTQYLLIGNERKKIPKIFSKES